VYSRFQQTICGSDYSSIVDVLLDFSHASGCLFLLPSKKIHNQDSGT